MADLVYLILPRDAPTPLQRIRSARECNPFKCKGKLQFIKLTGSLDFLYTKRRKDIQERARQGM